MNMMLTYNISIVHMPRLSSICGVQSIDWILQTISAVDVLGNYHITSRACHGTDAAEVCRVSNMINMSSMYMHGI